MVFESIDQPGWSSEVECNPKMSISCFWLERGGRWGLSPLTSLADHQKLNIIQKWAFHYSGCREVWHMGFESIDQPGGPSDVERNPKMSISCFWLERGGRWCLSPSTSPADHQKLNIIQKWAFHYFGWRWGLSPSTGPANHQKLNVIQKWAFHYFGWRWGLSPSTSPANHQKLNVIQKWAFHFFGWRGVVDGVWVHWPASWS